MALWLRIAVLCEFLLWEYKNGFLDTEPEELTRFAGVEQTILCPVPAVYSEPAELRRGRLA